MPRTCFTISLINNDPTNEKSTNEYFWSYKPMLYIMLVKKFSLCVDTKSKVNLNTTTLSLLILVSVKNIQQSIQNECSSMFMDLSYSLLILIANSKMNHHRVNVLILVMSCQQHLQKRRRSFSFATIDSSNVCH
jgi:hypothetical protein